MLSGKKEISVRDMLLQPENQGVALSERVYMIGRQLLSSGIKLGENGTPLPELKITQRVLLELIKREGIPPESKVNVYGPLSVEDIVEVHHDPVHGGKYPGLRSGYMIEHDGKPKYILLNSGMMGSSSTSGSPTGQTPFIRVILQPGFKEVPINVPAPKLIRSKRKGNGSSNGVEHHA